MQTLCREHIHWLLFESHVYITPTKPPSCVPGHGSPPFNLGDDTGVKVQCLLTSSTDGVARARCKQVDQTFASSLVRKGKKPMSRRRKHDLSTTRDHTKGQTSHAGTTPWVCMACPRSRNREMTRESMRSTVEHLNQVT